MKPTIFHIVRTVSAFVFLAGVFSCHSSNSNDSPSNRVVVGSFVGHYDADTGEVTYDPIRWNEDATQIRSLTIGDNTTGTLGCAILDNNLSPGDVNYCMGLVDPDNCSADYNDVTHVLSFYSRLRNRSDIADDGDPGVGYDYTDIANYAPNTTFLTPFHYVLTGIVPSGPPTDLVEVVNTDIVGAECGGDGLNLSDSNDDSEPDGQFDCIYPGNGDISEYNYTKDDYPGWDFSSHIPGGDLVPGEDTGCVVFMQYTLKQNQSVAFFFDVVAVVQDVSQPDPPEVTSPTDGSYSTTVNINVEGTTTTTPGPSSCDPAADVYVEGGTSTQSASCNANGTFSVSITLNAEQINTLSVYQVISPLQSGSVTLEVIHDNTAPTVVTSNPAVGETQVDRNTNCTVTFSEPMDESTFTTGTNCTNGTFSLCEGSTFLPGTITFSGDGTQAVLTPTTKPLTADTPHTCTVTTGVTDLAGNALAANEVIGFRTAPSTSEFSDTLPPAVRFTLPADNATVPPGTSVVIYFSEAINPSTINNIDAACSSTIPNLSIYEFPSGGCTGAGPVAGSFSLNTNGDIATFVPTSPPLSSNSSFMLVAQSCVEDLAGNQLPNRANLVACGSDTFTYNILYIFFTDSASETTAPTVVHVGPALNATNVPQPIFPFMVFSEPLDPATVVTDYFFITKLGYPAHLPMKSVADPTLQVVEYQLDSVLTTVDTATHVLTATGAVADLAGNLMSSPQTSQFSVTSTADATAPTVVSVTPSNPISPDPGGCGTDGNYMSKCSTFDVVFSEPMDPVTLNTANIELINFADGTCAATLKKPASVEVLDDGMGVRVVPVSSLRSGGACSGDRRRYYVQIDNVKDRAGNTIATTYGSTIFSACAETAAPSVTEVVPATGGTISANGNWAIFFREPMDKSTLTGANVAASSCLAIVTPAADGMSAVANCAFSIPSGGTLTIDRAVRDFYNGTNNASCEAGVGNQMAANETATYSVGGADSTSPTINNLTDISPQDESTGASTAATPSITFSEAIDPRTVTDGSVFLSDEAGNRVSANIGISNAAQTVTLTPTSALQDDTVYYLIATTAIRDLGGGLNYDGDGGEVTSVSNVLRACFGTGTATCP